MFKKNQKDNVKEVNKNRRLFFENAYKYVLGFGAFTLASLFGLRRNGEISIGQLKNFKVGVPEAQGTCGSSHNCSGGGGECGSAHNCSGGGGVCGSSHNCSGGGGQCGSAHDCAGE